MIISNVFCPHCRKKFDYDIADQELPGTTGGSASVFLYPPNNEAEEGQAYRKELYCPYCGQRFFVDIH